VANVLKSSPELDQPPAEEDGEGYAEVQILFSSDLPEAELARAYRLEDIAEAELSRLDPAALGAESREEGPRSDGERARSVESTAPETPASRGDYERSARASVRVDTAKLDDLWQLVGELVTCKARFGKLTGGLAAPARSAGSAEMMQDVEKITDSLERVTGRMQQAVMETRMVPIAVLFNKFPRLVRDLSRKLGKQVELELAGGEWIGTEEVKIYLCRVRFRGQEYARRFPRRTSRAPGPGEIVVNDRILVVARLAGRAKAEDGTPLWVLEGLHVRALR
jgi:two-component system chemotaxis sensor kinase CheA